MCGEAHCTAPPGALGSKMETWVYLNFLKICCQAFCRGSLSEQHAKITLISLIFHWYLKCRNKENGECPQGTASKTQLLLKHRFWWLSWKKNSRNFVYGHTQISSIWTEQHVKVQLLHWVWPQDTCKVTQHAKKCCRDCNLFSQESSALMKHVFFSEVMPFT